MPWLVERDQWIPAERLAQLMAQTVAEARKRICARPRRVLLLPPDITRAHSEAGWLTEVLYNLLSDEAEVHVIPTLGQHVPHTPEENRRMFGAIPEDRIHAHDWRGGCVPLGEIPADYVRQSSRGAADWPIPIRLNRMLIEEPWDLIVNVGHVVPHEVLGFANHNKNYFIGLGGKETICAAHIAAACCGIENNLGTLVTPVRDCFNKAENEFLGKSARPLRPGRHGAKRRRANWSTPASTWATTWRPIWKPPGNRASRTSPSWTSQSKKSFA